MVERNFPLTRRHAHLTSKVHGRTLGLKASQLQALERLYRRRLPRESAAPPELVRELATLTHETGRRLGLLVERSGEVTHVFAGDATALELPALGDSRRGAGRLKGLRWIATAFGSDVPPAKDLVAFVRARLDLLVIVAVSEDGTPWSLREASLLPASDDDAPLEKARGSGQRGSGQHEQAYELSPPRAPHAARTDLEVFLPELEDRFAAASAGARATDGGEGERAILVAVGTGEREDLDRSLAELRELARSAGARVVGELSQRRDKLDPRTLLGKGRVADVVALALRTDAELVVIDHELAPNQAKALEEQLGKVKVVDRTQLILDVFAQRARTSAGKLQVEIARLRYLGPRLVRQWEGLSRLRGGIGGNRGTGETRLELDRRAVRKRIERLEASLAKVRRGREVRRHRRLKGGIPQVAIVGYTNVGKSTLFNRITDSKVSAEDRQFDTLDPTMRRRRLPSGRVALISDTVGFLRELPQGLLEAFGATLDDLRDARLLVHVADASAPDCFEKIEQVRAILKELQLAEAREIVVFNKRDRLPVAENFLPLARGFESEALVISALEGADSERVVREVDRALDAILAEEAALRAADLEAER